MNKDMTLTGQRDPAPICIVSYYGFLPSCSSSGARVELHFVMRQEDGTGRESSPALIDQMSKECN